MSVMLLIHGYKNTEHIILVPIVLCIRIPKRVAEVLWCRAGAWLPPIFSQACRGAVLGRIDRQFTDKLAVAQCWLGRSDRQVSDSPAVVQCWGAATANFLADLLWCSAGARLLPIF